MTWRETAKRNLFVHCYSPEMARDGARVTSALRAYEVVAIAPGAWFVRTSASINRLLADVRTSVGENGAARILILDATEDQWVSWPIRAEAWPELDDLRLSYGWSQVDAQGRRATFERMTPAKIAVAAASSHPAAPSTSRLVHRGD